MVTLSLTSSTNFMPGPSSSPRELLHKPQLIDAVASRILQLIGQAAHEVQSDSAFALVRSRTGRGDRERVERLAVILHEDFDASAPHLKAHHDVVTHRIL